MKVSEVMLKQTECVGPNDSVARAKSIMRAGRILAIPVFDHAKVAGILVDSEIYPRAKLLERTIEQLKVSELMNSNASVAAPEEEQWVAQARMTSSHLTSLPVINSEGKLVGVLGQTFDR